MKIKDVTEQIQGMENYRKLPKYISASDISESQIKTNGNWQNKLYSWGIIYKDDKYTYFETDDEKGYISFAKQFEDENSACEYALASLKVKNDAFDASTPLDLAVRYIEREYGYSGKRAEEMVKRIIRYQDIFEEFFNYIRIGKFRKRDRTVVDVEGYTAERLNSEYNLSPLGAYNYLVYLREDPMEALADLHKGLPQK